MKKIWKKWKAFARKVGNFQARVVLSVFYFSIFAPFGFAVRVFSDPLRLKSKAASSFWLVREDEEAITVENLRRQS